jgi:L-ribulose-5-phosphate 4-epimerase
VLVLHHGPFTWGKDAGDAVDNARVLEYVARMEILVQATGDGRRHRFPGAPRPAPYLVDKHYLRKHGKGAYYGQERK